MELYRQEADAMVQLDVFKTGLAKGTRKQDATVVGTQQIERMFKTRAMSLRMKHVVYF